MTLNGREARMKRIILILIAALALAVPAHAQTIVAPKPSGHHHASAHAKGYLYFAEARYRTVRVVQKFARHQWGTYVIGACHRRGRLAVNCDVTRSRQLDASTTELCDYVSRVRKHVRANRTVSWWTRLDLAGTGCRLG